MVVAVVHAAQSMDVETRHDGSLCLSCLHLDLPISECRKVHSRSTLCRSCISFHMCTICLGITRDVGKVPLCRKCLGQKKKNYASWVCDACRKVNEPMLTECKQCESIVEPSVIGDSLDFHVLTSNKSLGSTSCVSCKYLGRLNGSYKKHGKTSWCIQCIAAHKCNVCHRLERAVGAVPLCSYCNDKGTKNFAH